MTSISATTQTAFHRLTRRQTWLNVLVLTPIFASAYVLSYWWRFDGDLDAMHAQQLWHTIGWAIGIKLFVFAGVYGSHHWGRYLTFHDLGTLFRASVVSSMLLLFGDFFFFPESNIPRSVVLMDWGTTVVAIGALRSIIRWIRECSSGLLSNGNQGVLIVGTNNSGEALLREIRRSIELPYRVEGFVSSDGSEVGSTIGGVHVHGTIDQTCSIAQKVGVKEVLITSGDVTGKQLRQLMNDCKRHDVSVKVLPSFEQLLAGRIGLGPRKVSIEDLLRRPPVKLDQRGMRAWLENRTILVSGSAGSIGSEICRQLLTFGPRKLICVDRSESGQFFLERDLRAADPSVELAICLADASDRTRMDRIFAEHAPDVIFHAAAYKHVPLMESNRDQAVHNIVSLTKNMADLAQQHGVKSFVMISTDKAVNPTSVMGACKRVAELYVQSMAESSDCRFVTVRFGNVLDSAGSVVPIFRQQIAQGGPITVTHEDMTRYFMMIPEASQLVIQAGCMGQGGEIFVLDMGEPVKIMDLAHDMIALSGLSVGDDIEVVVSGMRPGEKLYEELHIDGEKHVSTSHPKIMVAESTPVDRSLVIQGVQRLEQLAEGSPNLIVEQLHQLLPELRHEEITRHQTIPFRRPSKDAPKPATAHEDRPSVPFSSRSVSASEFPKRRQG